MRFPSGMFATNYPEDRAIIRTRFQWAMFLGFLALLLSLPHFGSSHLITLVTTTGFAVISCLGLNLLTGYCGQISVAQSAFMGVGGYTAAIITVRAGLPFWVALPCAGICAGLVGVFFGAPSLRIKGLYLALTSIAAQFILQFIFLHWTSMTGGSIGLVVPSPSLGPITLDTDISYYYLTIIIVIVMTYFAKRLVTTKVGRAFIAIRDNDIVAEGLGINPFYYKLLAFFICCFYAGVSGALWVFYVCVINVENYSLWQSVMLLGMVVIGGMGSIAGAIFGVLFVGGLGEITHAVAPVLARVLPGVAAFIGTALPLIVTGLVIMLFLIFEPRGLAHRWQLFRGEMNLWPFTY